MQAKSHMKSIVWYVFLVYLLTLAFNLSGNPFLLVISQITPLMATLLVIMFYPNRKQTFYKLGLGKIGGLCWYLISLFAGVPVLISFLIAWAMGYVDLPSLNHFPGHGDRLLWMIKHFFQISYLLTPILFAWGEEIGWRGYLQSQLLEEVNDKKAFVYTGLIWAVFHYPFYLNGYNESGNVWINIILFTLTLIPLSIVMGWIRLKSKSLWPVVLFHAMINHQRSFWEIFFYDKHEGWSYIAGETGIISLIVWSILAFIIWKFSIAKKAVQQIT